MSIDGFDGEYWDIEDPDQVDDDKLAELLGLYEEEVAHPTSYGPRSIAQENLADIKAQIAWRAELRKQDEDGAL